MQKLVNGVLVDMTQKEIDARNAETTSWKTEKSANEYKEKRKAEYPDIGDQLDVLWKQFNQNRLNGQPLIQEADDMLGEILSIKNKYKP